MRQTEQLVKQLTQPPQGPQGPETDPLGVDYAAVAAKELGDSWAAGSRLSPAAARASWS